jgi:hypothetical protein
MFSKNTQILMKICSVGAELFHVDGRTDTKTDKMKLIISFGNFRNTPKNENLSCPDFLATNIISVFLFTVFMFLHNTLTTPERTSS